MTFDEIEYEIQKIITNMKEAVEEEEKNPAKTANYELYKERLKTALKLQVDIAEAKKTNEPQDAFEEIFEYDLWELKQPIY
ncbi:MAG: hypothetical protein HDR56_01015 [Treponema sp.]|nr:hypothetical protein [Treponema sp.]